MSKNLTPQEALERVKLMMKYDLKKTLNENIEEQSSNPDVVTQIQTTVDDSVKKEYFQFIATSFLKNPENIKTNFGQPTGNVQQVAKDIYDAIGGLQISRSQINTRNNKIKEIANYISRTSKFENIIGLAKVYPEVGGESLYDALDGEYFAGDILQKMIDIIATGLEKWCSTKTGKNTPPVCVPKTKEQMKQSYTQARYNF